MEEIINNETPFKEQIILPKKSKINIWMILTLILSMILIFGGFYMYSLSKKINNIVSEKEKIIIETPIPTQIPTTVISPTVKNKMSITDIISEYCIDEKINLDKLPFKLDKSFIEKYGIDRELSCNKKNDKCGMLPSEDDCNLQIKTQRLNNYYEKDDISVRFSYLNFISKNAVDASPDSFTSLSKYCLPILINGQNYWIYIESVGPNGISSEGIYVSLISEKNDSLSDTLVRSNQAIEIKNKQIIDSLKKYGCKSSGNPEYYFRREDCGDWSSFQKELVGLLQNHSTFQKIAENADNDLNGVSF